MKASGKIILSAAFNNANEIRMFSSFLQLLPCIKNIWEFRALFTYYEPKISQASFISGGKFILKHWPTCRTIRGMIREERTESPEKASSSNPAQGRPVLEDFMKCLWKKRKMFLHLHALMASEDKTKTYVAHWYDINIAIGHGEGQQGKNNGVSRQYFIQCFQAYSKMGSFT